MDHRNIRRIAAMAFASGLLSLVPIGSPAGAVEGFAGACTLETDQTNLHEGPTDYSINTRPIGTLRGILVFVDFPDAPATDAVDDLFAKLGPPSEDYFDQASQGLLDLQLDATTKWYHLSNDSTTYGIDGGQSTYAAHRAYLQAAVNAATEDVDFSRYDLLYVVSAPNAEGIGYSPAYIGYPGSRVRADGHELRGGATLGRDVWDETRQHMVLVHETGHVFGLPDLYDFDSDNAPNFDSFHYAGSWDPMSDLHGRAGFLAWHRMKMGWLDESRFVCVNGPTETTVTLSPSSGTGSNQAVVVRTGRSTAYVVENRQASGVDAALCNEGVLIYEVDAAKETGYGPVRVFRAQQTPADFECANASAHFDSAFAPFGFGTGRVSLFEDGDLTVEVVGKSDSSYEVRIDYRGAGYVPPPPPERVTHVRHIVPTLLTYKDGKLTVRGAIRTEDEHRPCEAAMPVHLQRRDGRKWVTIARKTSDAEGRFTVAKKTPLARFRLRAPQRIVGSEPEHVCTAAAFALNS